MTKLIILDRDGVINYDSENYIKSPNEWMPYPESLIAISNLTAAGYTVSIATNQSGIARGLYNEATLADIHAKMSEAVTAAGGKIDSIFYCPHGPDKHCDCRKPQPGLLKQIQEHYKMPDLTNIPFVGDSWRDIQAGQAAGCQPVLVKTGNGETTHRNHKNELENIWIFDNLLTLSHHILSTN